MDGRDDDLWRRRRTLVRASMAAHDGAPDPSLVHLLESLCRGATAYLELQGAAVNLMSRSGSRGVVAASDAHALDLVEMQFTTGEGPCHDAFERRRPVLTADLGSGQGQRWPGYSSLALAAGVRAVFAFPLQVGAVGLGVLDLFGARPGALADEQVAMALAFAEMGTEILLDGRLITAAGDLDPDLDAALHYRAEIYQAQGMLMVSLDVELAEALARMRAHAFGHGRPLLELARQIIDGRVFADGEI